MPIAQAMCTSFKAEMFDGVHDLNTDVIKLALYTSSASLGSATTVYTTDSEVVGAGYTAGGNTLTGATITTSGTTAIVDFADTSWTSATITARGALIYNFSKANRAIAVLDFGSDKSSINGTFTIQFPTPDASNAILRNA